MPATLAAPPEDLGEFASLVPSESSATQPDLGEFADLVPKSDAPLTEAAATDVGGRKSEVGSEDDSLGEFASLVPKPPAPETAKAALATPDTSFWHQTFNTLRETGSALGQYFAQGIAGAMHAGAKALADEGVAAEPNPLLSKYGFTQDMAREQSVQTMERAKAVQERAGSFAAESQVDPELATTIPARLARAAGGTLGAVGESLIPGIGLPLMAGHAGYAAYSAGLDMGQSEEQATRAGVATAVGMSLFGAVNMGAAAGVAKLLAKAAPEAGTLTKFIAQFAGQDAANELSLRALRATTAGMDAPEGDRLRQAIAAAGEINLEDSTFNALFAGIGAAKASGEPPVKGEALPVKSEAPVVTSAEPITQEPVTSPTSEPATAGQAQESSPQLNTDQTQIEKSVEQMSPSDYVNAGVEIPKTANAGSLVLELADNKKAMSAIRADNRVGPHAVRTLEAVKAHRDVSATSIDQYGIELPAGYVREGDLYVYSGKEPTGGLSTLDKLKRVAAEAGPAESTVEVPETAQAKNDWTRATAVDPQAVAGLAPGTGTIIGGTMKAQSLAGEAIHAVRDLPEFHDYRKATLDWSARGQFSTGETMTAAHEIEKALPDKATREGITNWIQAGGDKTLLQQRAQQTADPRLKRGYEAAAHLTPEQEAVAQKVRDTYDTLLQRAKAHGIEINEIENYVNQLWKKRPAKNAPLSMTPETEQPGYLRGRRLSTAVRFAKQRYWNSFFEGEQSGLRPETKDISKLLPIYMNEVNAAINAKRYVADLSAGKASDGRPLLAPSGMVRTIGEGEAKSYLVLPKFAEAESRDYKSLGEHPALRSWRWRAADEAGNPIYVQGDLRVHPEVAGRMENVLGESAIKRWYKSANETALGGLPKNAVKFLVDDLQQVGKATMLGFVSPFHQVQEGTHAVGHRVNPFFNIPKVDMTRPEQFDAARHGLMMLPDRASMASFRDGVDGSSRNLLANLIGKLGKPGAKVKDWIDGYQDYLFHQYIPGLKFKTYEHALPRNMERFAKELKSGEISEDQVKYLTAQQMNAAYGHLNYADLGRDPTIQHILRATLLAPDFLEARGRFTAQAGKSFLASKAGHEQLAAIATLAVTTWLAARVLNKTLDGDYHFEEPFGVISGTRRYTMRSVPEDIWNAFKDTRRFVYGRLSPFIGRGTIEGLSGVNYRGEPTTFGQTLMNLLAGMIPLTVQPATRGLTETGRENPVSPLEQWMGTVGLHVSRYAPTTHIYQLSKDWIDQHGKEYGIDPRKAVYPISKYQQLRYALEDNDAERARAEIAKLIASGMPKYKIGEGVKESFTHPFTGSDKTDRAFKKSLGADDQYIFEAAKKRQKELLRRYYGLR